MLLKNCCRISYFCCSCSLYSGAITAAVLTISKENFCLVWLFAVFITQICEGTHLFFFTIFKRVFMEDVATKFFIGFVIWIYMWIVVWSFYWELKDPAPQQSRRNFFTNQRRRTYRNENQEQSSIHYPYPTQN
uniref:Uncharacterized protein n=1 Tax=Strigamia maritima TaxID=126957 RepID=T1ILX8_STRMM